MPETEIRQQLPEGDGYMVGLVHRVAEHERRITTLEENTVALADTQLEILRRVVHSELGLNAIMAHLKVPPPSDEEVDAAFEAALN